MSKEKLVELLLQTETFTADNAEYARQQAEYKADYLLANGVIVPPCKVGDEINGEVVNQIEYTETLVSEGKTNQLKIIHTCNKDDVEKLIQTTHLMTWEKAEAKLKESKKNG